MKQLLFKLLPIMLTMTLIGCASRTFQDRDFVVNHQKVLQAAGFSSLKKSSALSPAQNKFAIEQAAALAAYQGLAKQIYNEYLADNLKIADQVMADESYRIYLDLFLRNALVVDSKIVSNRQKIVLALTLTPRFYRCISHSIKEVQQCINEDGKVPFTRLGFQQAETALKNLQCVDLDCLTPLYVAGFSEENNPLDQRLLNIGLYDAEWTVNMAARVALRYFVLSGMVFK